MTFNSENPAPYANPNAASTPAANPGKTMGIVGLVLGIVGFVVAFLAPIAGIIVSIIGLNRSRAAGQKNGLAVAGIIVSVIALIVNIIAVVVLVSLAATFGTTAAEILQQCEADPTGTVEFQGQQITCEDLLRGSN